jgi:hypothetical protein
VETGASAGFPENAIKLFSHVCERVQSIPNHIVMYGARAFPVRKKASSEDLYAWLAPELLRPLFHVIDGLGIELLAFAIMSVWLFL